MKKKYSITGIDCANCAAKLEAKMNELPQVEQVTLTFATQQLLESVNTIIMGKGADAIMSIIMRKRGVDVIMNIIMARDVDAITNIPMENVDTTMRSMGVIRKKKLWKKRNIFSLKIWSSFWQQY